MNVLKPIEEACKQLREDPGLRLLRIIVEPDLDEFFARWLESWEKSDENDQVVLKLDAPFAEPEQYAQALYDQIQQKRAEAASTLAEKKIELPSPVPFAHADDFGTKSLVDELRVLGEKTSQLGGQLVAAVVPKEIEQPIAWCRHVERLVRELSSSLVKLVTFDRPTSSYLEPLTNPRNPISEGVKSLPINPNVELLQKDLEEDLGKPLKPAERITTLLMLAGFDFGNGRPDAAITRHLQALQVCHNAAFKAQEALIHYNLGGLKMAKDDAAGAKEHFEKAGMVALKMENYPLATSAAMGLGDCLDKMGDSQNALRYFEEGAKLASLGGFWQMACQTNLKLGQTLARAGRYDEAQKGLESARNQIDKLGEPLNQMAESLRKPIEAELSQLRGKLKH